MLPVAIPSLLRSVSIQATHATRLSNNPGVTQNGGQPACDDLLSIGRDPIYQYTMRSGYQNEQEGDYVSGGMTYLT
jgi:hypothetical protein